MTGGKEAVELYGKLASQDKLVSHILTEFMMPQVNGIALIDQIKFYVRKQQDRGKDIEEPKFIFVTSQKTETFQKLVSHLNVEAILEKPVKSESLKPFF